MLLYHCAVCDKTTEHLHPDHWFMVSRGFLSPPFDAPFMKENHVCSPKCLEDYGAEIAKKDAATTAAAMSSAGTGEESGGVH